MATYRKRGSKWRAEIRRRHLPYESAEFATKAEAQAWAARRESATGGKLPKRLLHEAFDRYAETVSAHKKGQRWERTRIARFKRELPDRPLTTLTPDAIALIHQPSLVAASLIAL